MYFLTIIYELCHLNDLYVVYDKCNEDTISKDGTYKNGTSQCSKKNKPKPKG